MAAYSGSARRQNYTQLSQSGKASAANPMAGYQGTLGQSPSSFHYNKAAPRSPAANINNFITRIPTSQGKSLLLLRPVPKDDPQALLAELRRGKDYYQKRNVTPIINIGRKPDPHLDLTGIGMPLHIKGDARPVVKGQTGTVTYETTGVKYADARSKGTAILVGFNKEHSELGGSHVKLIMVGNGSMNGSNFGNAGITMLSANEPTAYGARMHGARINGRSANQYAALAPVDMDGDGHPDKGPIMSMRLKDFTLQPDNDHTPHAHNDDAVLTAAERPKYDHRARYLAFPTPGFAA
jgi:hypothetical protein